LAAAPLPWLVVAAHRGMGEARRWRWPAIGGLVLACAGGGVNAALLPWIIAAPLALVLYEWIVLRARTRRDVWSFSWRAALCALVASLWWLIPIVLQRRYGTDILSFTEQPETIWATPSMSESLRLLGYWIFYFWTDLGGVSQPSFESASTYLFNGWIIIATFAVPLLAFASLRLLRRWRFAPYFLAMALFALLVMAAGFPEGKPLENALRDAYYDLPALQALRTTYKAGPILALSLSCLGGAGAVALFRRVRAAGGAIPRRVGLVVGGVALIAVPVLYALPFFTGRALDGRLRYHVPRYWSQALADANKTTPQGRRLMIVPGQLFGWYRWGGTLSSVAPALTKRPVLIREVTRYATPRASQLLTSVDDLVQQSRVVPGQLVPLLQLIAVGQVLVPTDARSDLTGAADPASVRRSLGGRFAPGASAQNYGSNRTYVPQAGRGGAPELLPDLRRYPLPGSGPGIVRIHSRARPTVVDGDADGVTELAAVGLLHPDRALFYAGDLRRRQLVDEVKHGADLVFTDSSRRRYVSGVQVVDDRGPTLGPSDPIPRGLPSYDLFPQHGSATQTVAEYGGVRYLRTPGSISLSLLPQYRPYAAFDGRPDTTWLVGTREPGDGPLDLALTHARVVPSIRVLPHRDHLGYPIRIGVTVNGGSERSVRVRRSWNTIAIGSKVNTLRLRVLQMSRTPFGGSGGLDEVQIPGVNVRESLRLPTMLASATRGLDLSHNNLSVSLERTTADYPYRAGANVSDAQQKNPFDMVDAEPGLRRTITLPVARSFGVGGWGSVSPDAPDHAIDGLVGMRSAWRFDSSSRFEGVPIQRASSAFDGNPRTAWVADFTPRKTSWIRWVAPRELRIRRFRLVPANPAFAFPTVVRINEPGHRPVVVRVDNNGEVILPRPIVTRTVRMDVLDAGKFPGDAADRSLSAVGVSEIQLRKLRPPKPRRGGNFQAACGAIRVLAPGGQVNLTIGGTVKQLDAGAPLGLGECGPHARLPLGAGSTTVAIPPAPVFRADHVRLFSPAPLLPTPQPTRPPGTIVDQGSGGAGSRDGARVSVREPGWLVLAESYSRGWSAYCRDGSGREHNLGSPVPIDAFANGWPVTPGCRVAHFVFAPQHLADAAYWVSLAACLGMLALLLVRQLVGFSRRQRGGERFGGNGRGSAQWRPHVPMPSWTSELPDPVRRLPLRAAVPVAAAAGLLGGVAFAWRAGPALALAVLGLLLVGVSVRRTLALATVGLLAVPILYVVNPAPDIGGANIGYSQHYIGAHWVAVGAVCALIWALALWLVQLRVRDGGRGTRTHESEPPDAVRPGPREPDVVRLQDQ
jgi:arabinofuranan 3-O-arabinosyltransferase